MSPSEKEVDISVLELAIKWAHDAALMYENPEVSYLFELSETALREKLERLNSIQQPNITLTLGMEPDRSAPFAWAEHFQSRFDRVE